MCLSEVPPLAQTPSDPRAAGLLVLSLLGSSFPADQHVEDALVARLGFPVLRYRSLIDRYQRGAHLGALEARLSLLRQAIADHPGRRILVIGRSSGAITATRLAADEPGSIAGIVALGYPFRHPDTPADAPPEPERVAHLPGLTVPLLVVQGDRDAYGPALDVLRYALPPGVRLLQVQGTHELRLSPREWDYVSAAIVSLAEIVEGMVLGA